MIPNARQDGNSWLAPLFSGIIYAMLVAGTSTIALSVLLAVTGLKEQSLPVYVYVIHALAVLVGGFVNARKAGERGWYRGGLLGLVYSLIVVLVSWLGFDAPLSLQTLLFVAASFLAGALGGILGINAGSRP